MAHAVRTSRCDADVGRTESSYCTRARVGNAAADTRVLLLVGELDDWTPPQACQRLAAQAADPRPVIETYRGAYHGFDSTVPVRLRTDVPNGLNPGKGVHVGRNPAALKQSRERLLQFLAAAAASEPSR